MILVIDASVALKWFFQTRDGEADTEKALAILSGVDAGDYQLVQPPHFLAEIAAVLAREKPEDAQDDLIDLQSVEWDVCEDPTIYATAVDLAREVQHHLFDTLYHAVAMHVSGATLVTADRRYYARVKDRGAITLLGSTVDRGRTGDGRPGSDR